MRALVSICALYYSDQLVEALTQQLGETEPAEQVAVRYELKLFSSESQFLDFVLQPQPLIDCLILEQSPAVQKVLNQLQQHAVFFPAVVVSSYTAEATDADLVYHPGILKLPASQIDQIQTAVDEAIQRFVLLTPTSQSDAKSTVTLVEPPPAHRSLMERQTQLAEKLKARLGYLGVYYKRNPTHFLRHMNQAQRDELLRQLEAEYREIILAYFSDNINVNQQIDNFVNAAFLADVAVSQIVEIHMQLMDEFSKQLRLEGRSDEILQDYRLTLIDTIAHLCEMYRRSIPRES